MPTPNVEKRKAAYQFLLKHYGAERADYLMAEGWTAVYADLMRNGYTWSDRKRKWGKSIRPVQSVPTTARAVKRYDYARIALDCPVADVELTVDAWSQLVDIYGYKVWRNEVDNSLNRHETTRLVIFIRKER
jgi:hypothetical protein